MKKYISSILILLIAGCTHTPSNDALIQDSARPNRPIILPNDQVCYKTLSSVECRTIEMDNYPGMQMGSDLQKYYNRKKHQSTDIVTQMQTGKEDGKTIYDFVKQKIKEYKKKKKEKVKEKKKEEIKQMKPKLEEEEEEEYTAPKPLFTALSKDSVQLEDEEESEENNEANKDGEESDYELDSAIHSTDDDTSSTVRYSNQAEQKEKTEAKTDSEYELDPDIHK